MKTEITTMESEHPSCCCCVFSLRTGSLIVALFQIVLSILLSGSYYMIYGWNLQEIVLHISITNLQIHIIPALILYIGTLKNNFILCHIWLIVQFIWLTLISFGIIRIFYLAIYAAILSWTEEIPMKANSFDAHHLTLYIWHWVFVLIQIGIVLAYLNELKEFPCPSEVMMMDGDGFVKYATGEDMTTIIISKENL